MCRLGVEGECWGEDCEVTSFEKQKRKHTVYPWKQGTILQETVKCSVLFIYYFFTFLMQGQGE